jgi:hypothetical protein
MKIFRSKAYRHAERSLATAQTQEQVDTVRNNAMKALTPKEFGRFGVRIADRRQQLAEIALADGR